MSYIEDFLEANMELPKDFIRNLKLIREIDEKVTGTEALTSGMYTRVEENKRNLKTRIKNSKPPDDETTKAIEKLREVIKADLDQAVILSDHKIELVNECQYLIEQHLGQLSDKIEGYEKYTQSMNPIDRSYDNTDAISVATSSK
jgi:hypothetical protein